MSLFHPRGVTLSRYADGELEGRRSEAVRRHVQGCARCREYVAFIHELSAAAAAEYRDETSYADVAAEVLRRRRAGERIELAPLETRPRIDRDERVAPAARRGWRVGLGIAACGLLLALAGIFLFDAPPVAAGHSELDFGTELAAPGSTLEVVYSPAVFLADHDSLRLRLRSRTEDTPAPGDAGVIGRLRTVTLHRGDDGEFRGSLAVEPDEVYLAAAVEDFSGTDVDTNLGRLWDVLVSKDGAPSTAALESQLETLATVVNRVQATARMRELAERYPDNPLTWAMLWRHLEDVSLEPPPDSVVSFHRAKLRELIDLETRRGPTPDDLLMLFAYARWLEEPQVADSLLDEVERLDPGNAVVAAWKLPDPRDGLEAWLERAERVWAASDQDDDGFVLNALYVAGESGDLEAVRRWTDRGRRLGYLSLRKMASRLDPYDFAAAERVRLRREWLERLRTAGEERRPLGQSRREYRAWKRDQIDRARSALARDLLLLDDTASSRSLLASVAATSWHPSLLQPYADFLLAAGDTSAALDVVGTLLADPVSGPAERKRYDPVVDRHVDDRDEFLRHGIADYHRRVRASVDFSRRLPADTRLYFADGTTSTAAAHLSGSPALLVFFQPELPGIEAWIADVLERVATVSAGDELAVLLVAKGSAPDFAARLEATSLVVDRGLDLTQRLRAWGSQDFLIVDENLDATDPSSLDDALRIAGALQSE